MMTSTMTRPVAIPEGLSTTGRVPRPLLRPLPRERASSRVTAYVYGNIATLAALVSLDRSAAASGHGFLLVLGVAATTFLAHALADAIGRRVRSEHPLGRSELLGELRDSVPVLSSATMPVLMLAAAWLAHVPSLFAQLVGGGYLVLRLALTGSMVARLRGVASWRVIAAGIALALLGLVVVLLKALVQH